MLKGAQGFITNYNSSECRLFVQLSNGFGKSPFRLVRAASGKIFIKKYSLLRDCTFRRLILDSLEFGRMLYFSLLKKRISFFFKILGQGLTELRLKDLKK